MKRYIIIFSTILSLCLFCIIEASAQKSRIQKGQTNTNVEQVISRSQKKTLVKKNKSNHSRVSEYTDPVVEVDDSAGYHLSINDFEYPVGNGEWEPRIYDEIRDWLLDCGYENFDYNVNKDKYHYKQYSFDGIENYFRKDTGHLIIIETLGTSTVVNYIIISFNDRDSFNEFVRSIKFEDWEKYDKSNGIVYYAKEGAWGDIQVNANQRIVFINLGVAYVTEKMAGVY